MKSIIICLLFLPGALLFTRAKNALAQDVASEAPSEKATLSEPMPIEETTLSEPMPILEIKRLQTERPLYAFELRDVEIGDLFRVLAHDYKLNLLVDKEVGGTVTASLSNVSLEEALETIAEAQNLSLKKKGNIIRVSLHLITKTFTLKFIEAKGLLEASGSTDSSATSSTGSAMQAGTIYDLLSEKGKVFLGKQPNSLIVMDYPANIAKIEGYLKESDQKMATRVFKLKYLKASDVVGRAGGSALTSGTTSTATPAQTQPSDTASK